MKKVIIALLLSIVNSQLSICQVGTWRNYLAYQEVQQIQAAGDYLFVRASNGLYQYNKNDQSIYTYDKTNGLSDTGIDKIRWCQQGKKLVVIYNNQNIDLVETDGSITNISDIYTKAITGDKSIYNITVSGLYAYLSCGFGIVKLNVKNAEISESYMFDYPVTAIAFDDSYIYAQTKGNGVWKGSLKTNLIDKSNWQKTNTYPSFAEDMTDYNQYIDLVKTLKPGGPKYNYFGFIRYKFNRLYSCGGGYNVNGDLQRPGTIQILKDEEWIELPSNIAEITGWNYIDLVSLDASPKNPQHIFASGRTGLYEFLDGQFITAYSSDNSPLEPNVGTMKEWTLVEGLTFDEEDNLWCLNSGAPTQALLELTNNKVWNSYLNDELKNDDGRKSLYGLSAPFIDSRGLLWFVNYHWKTPAVFCYDIKNKELIHSIKQLINQDGTDVGVYFNPSCITEDLEGNIWIGSNNGPVMIEKANIYTKGTNVTQVKVPRNDGTDYADYLLANVSISCMAIDGAGRKWFGTNDDGVYLISADNMKEIHHFKSDNSFLLSNNIESLAINNQTGEVFIGTYNGLCSYISDATEAHEEMNKDNVYAYPNPVTPDYTGLITIIGLSYNADVKILSANGALVAEGRSSGGTFTWDGCDKNGNRVASGVYMVAIATNTGNKGVVTKIAIVR